MASPLSVDDLPPPVLDDLFGRLMQRIPARRQAPPMLGDRDCEEVLVHGQRKLVELLGLPSDELTRVESGGRLFPDLEPEAIRQGVTPRALQKAIRKGATSLGTLGGGNHFLELQEIVEVLDPHRAGRLGLRRGYTVFMLHTDSQRLGKKILEPLLEEGERAHRTDRSGDLWTLPADGDLGYRYRCALAAATHAGFANRAVIAHILRRSLQETFADPSLRLSLVYDCGHETIRQETFGGAPVWVHRHGASRALPASAARGDEVLEEIGQPVSVPGSMGTHSYLAVAEPGAAHTYHSVAHGAGRVMEKDEAKERYEADQVERDLAQQGIRLYRSGKDNIAGQAPASFKSPHQVLDVMTAFNLVRPVVRLRPIAVLKG
jgi:tRNA-splicing ligase RtcB